MRAQQQQRFRPSEREREAVKRPHAVGGRVPYSERVSGRVGGGEEFKHHESIRCNTGSPFV